MPAGSKGGEGEVSVQGELDTKGLPPAQRMIFDPGTAERRLCEAGSQGSVLGLRVCCSGSCRGPGIQQHVIGTCGRAGKLSAGLTHPFPVGAALCILLESYGGQICNSLPAAQCFAAMSPRTE